MEALNQPTNVCECLAIMTMFALALLLFLSLSVSLDHFHFALVVVVWLLFYEQIGRVCVCECYSAIHNTQCNANVFEFQELSFKTSMHSAHSHNIQ